jgi:hypothetical protein
MPTPQEAQAITPAVVPVLNLLGDLIQTDPRTGKQYEPEAAAEPFDVALLASEYKPDLSRFFGRDHDFLITGLSGTQTGEYKVQLILPSGRQYSSSAINRANLIGSSAAFPKDIWPGILVPANGKIGLNITDLSAAANTVQIVFHGFRLYPVK